MATLRVLKPARPYRDPVRGALSEIALDTTLPDDVRHKAAQALGWVAVVSFKRDPNCPDRHVQYCDYYC
jgi:hypothetical protein